MMIGDDYCCNFWGIKISILFLVFSRLLVLYFDRVIVFVVFRVSRMRTFISLIIAKRQLSLEKSVSITRLFIWDL